MLSILRRIIKPAIITIKIDIVVRSCQTFFITCSTQYLFKIFISKASFSLIYTYFDISFALGYPVANYIQPNVKHLTEILNII